METWYNTLNLSGNDLKLEVAKAKVQGELILSIFKANPGTLLTPSQIHTVFGKKYFLYPPLTSIRRAMSNLTKEGLLEKTDESQPGIFHLPEHKWKLKTESLYANETKSAGDFASELIHACRYTQPVLF